MWHVRSHLHMIGMAFSSFHLSYVAMLIAVDRYAHSLYYAAVEVLPDKTRLAPRGIGVAPLSG